MTIQLIYSLTQEECSQQILQKKQPLLTKQAKEEVREKELVSLWVINTWCVNEWHEQQTKSKFMTLFHRIN